MVVRDCKADGLGGGFGGCDVVGFNKSNPESLLRAVRDS
jgi:hypothetical protein